MTIQGLIEECGFEATGVCSAKELKTKPEVRDMCAAGKCHAYGKSWACPPACGDIEHFQNLINGYDNCFIAQTYGQLEDSFDIETMMELEQAHRERVLKLNELVKERYPEAMVLSAGTCTLCSECTYPDSPCRFPDRQMVSMEAAGLVVTEVCTKAGVPYNHGPNTMAYTSCVVA